MSAPVPPTPEEVAAAETIIDAAQVQQEQKPPESTWLLHYTGTTPLEKAGYTWQPDEALPIPESVARTLIGSNSLRVVQDEDWFHAARARAAGARHG